MAKLPFYLQSAKVLNLKLRCTVHKSGKLGFTTETSNALKIKEGMGIELYTDGETATELKAYMVVLPEKTEESFRVNKAGSYYYGATTTFFDKFFKDLGLDYHSGPSYVFEMTPAEHEGTKYYILTGRTTKNKEEENEIQQEEEIV